MYVRKTSVPMAPGTASAMRSMMTDTMYGSRFFVMILRVGVPRQREARLYSRSRMMTIWLRMKRAIENQPVRHMTNVTVNSDGRIM